MNSTSACPKVSIILPTYNVADYIGRCLKSVADLQYPNFEVIIIVDGATDGSYELAKVFSQKDTRFSVYWQENMGSGPARNAGISRAQGDLILFIDPDDWVEPELLYNLVSAQQEGDYDLVASKRTIVYCDDNNNIISTKHLNYNDTIIIGENNVRQSYIKMLEMGVVGDPTQKLYKTSLIKENGIEFPPLRRSQDYAFNMRYYSFVKSIRLISYSGYCYRIMAMRPPGKSGQDYYKTVVWFYDEYKKMYRLWNITFPDEEICTYLFDYRLNPNLQQFAAHGWDMKTILSNYYIQQITQKAVPKSFHKKIIKILIVLKFYKILVTFLKIELFLKRICIRRMKS